MRGERLDVQLRLAGRREVLRELLRVLGVGEEREEVGCGVGVLPRRRAPRYRPGRPSSTRLPAPRAAGGGPTPKPPVSSDAREIWVTVKADSPAKKSAVVPGPGIDCDVKAAWSRNFERLGHLGRVERALRAVLAPRSGAPAHPDGGEVVPGDVVEVADHEAGLAGRRVHRGSGLGDALPGPVAVRLHLGRDRKAGGLAGGRRREHHERRGRERVGAEGVGLVVPERGGALRQVVELVPLRGLEGLVEQQQRARVHEVGGRVLEDHARSGALPPAIWVVTVVV